MNVRSLVFLPLFFNIIRQGVIFLCALLLLCFFFFVVVVRNDDEQRGRINIIPFTHVNGHWISVNRKIESANKRTKQHQQYTFARAKTRSHTLRYSLRRRKKVWPIWKSWILLAKFALNRRGEKSFYSSWIKIDQQRKKFHLNIVCARIIHLSLGLCVVSVCMRVFTFTMFSLAISVLLFFFYILCFRTRIKSWLLSRRIACICVY